MSDTMRASCPNCGAVYKLPASAVGKSATCKQCESKFAVSCSPTDIALPDPELPPAGVVVPRQPAATRPHSHPQIVYVEVPAGRRRESRPERAEVTHRAAGSFSSGFGTTFGCLAAVAAFGACVIFLCGGGLTVLGLAPGAAARMRAENERSKAVAAADVAKAAADVRDAPPPPPAPKPCTIMPEKPGSYFVPMPAGRLPEHVVAYEQSANDVARGLLVKSGDVCMVNAPTAAMIEMNRDGWSYIRPTEGPHKGKLLVVRETTAVVN